MAGNICVYAGCYLSRRKDPNLRFFRIPNYDSEIMGQWLENSGNPELLDLSPEALYRKVICEKHISPDYIYPSGRLMRGAVPWHYKERVRCKSPQLELRPQARITYPSAKRCTRQSRKAQMEFLTPSTSQDQVYVKEEGRIELSGPEDSSCVHEMSLNRINEDCSDGFDADDAWDRLTNEVHIKAEFEDGLDISEEQVYVKAENEEGLDISEEQIGLDVHETFIKVEDPLDCGDAQDSSDVLERETDGDPLDEMEEMLDWDSADGFVISGRMNLRKLCRIMADRRDLLSYLISKGLLVRDPPCRICRQPMALTFRRACCYQQYRCRRGAPKPHWTYRDPLKNSWFADTEMPMDKALLFAYMFALGYTNIKLLMRETSTPESMTQRSTVCNWLGYCRGVTLHWCERNQSRELLGGSGVIVAVDEALMTTRKVGENRTAKAWAVGLTEVNVGDAARFRIEICPQRDQNILLPRIERLIELDTVVISDQWKKCYVMTTAGLECLALEGGEVVVLSPTAGSPKFTELQWKVMKGKVIGVPMRPLRMAIQEHLWRCHVKMNSLDPYEHFLSCIKELYQTK